MQIAALLIAALGFDGYVTPAYIVSNCLFCRYSNGKKVFAFDRDAPQANTESLFSASVIGCTYYIVLAIVWSMIWWGCGGTDMRLLPFVCCFIEPSLLFCGLSYPVRSWHHLN